DRQRSRPSTDQCDALAILLRRNAWQPGADIVLIVRGNALQSADRHRLFLDAAAAAGRLAGPIAGAAEDPWKHIRYPVDHICVGITPSRDETDIFRNRRMCRTGPLTIDNFVEVIRGRDIRRLQSLISLTAHIPRPASSSSDRYVLFGAPLSARSSLGEVWP